MDWRWYHMCRNMLPWIDTCDKAVYMLLILNRIAQDISEGLRYRKNKLRLNIHTRTATSKSMTSYKLGCRIRFPAGAQFSCLVTSALTSGFGPASYTIGTDNSDLLTSSGYVTVAGCSGHSNEPSGSLEGFCSRETASLTRISLTRS